MSDLKVDGIIASTGTNTALTLQGKGSGVVTIGDGNLKFPDADGSANEMIITNGSAQLSFTAQPTSGFTMGTEVSASGQVITFGSIPTGVTQIIMSFAKLSNNDDDNSWIIRIGDEDGIDATGYLGTGWKMEGTSVGGATNETTGFPISENQASGVAASAALSGQIILTLVASDTFSWTMTGALYRDAGTAVAHFGGGTYALPKVLTQVALTTTGGSATWDAGEVNIMYQ